MRHLYKTCISVALFGSLLVGCSSSDYVEKTNKERFTSYQTKLSSLRTEDAVVLRDIDDALGRASLLLDRAKISDLDESDEVTLLLDAAEAVLVEANTRRLYSRQKRSYVIAEQAYNERASRIRTLRDQYEHRLPAQKEVK